MGRFDQAVARGRRLAEARMRDTCQFRRKTGTSTNPATGKITPVYANGYAGKCRLKQPSPTAAPATVGEAVVVMVGVEVHIPMGAAPVPQTGDECVITASTGDPDLVGRVFVVDAPHRHADATARRLKVKERTS
ncbi:hypothetical protein GA0070622_0897 [Micromonospora sediminicola]|uniref:Uncharacterized protein n=1 Tax=Micromonospora sediminicola TaxID=946078 RepID=A0A1A9B4H7_9ACTN|nr:DUF6093 family protein [Micromonospora sediminicola]SBT63929.1 hypothetical protein GA0070622_0897 [Micromonospora sediminicola]